MSKFNYGNNNAANDDGAAVDAILGEVKSLIQPAVELQDTVKAIKSQQSGIVSDVKKLIDFMNGGNLKGSSIGGGASLGQQITAKLPQLLPDFKSHKRVRLEVKNTILGESGNPQNPDRVLVAPSRIPGIVPGAFRSLNVLDVIPQSRTSSNLIEYTRENTFTNAAAERSENTLKPESAATFTLVSEQVRTISHWLKVSRQVLDDSAALASYLDQRMTHGLLNRLQTQIISGNGTTPNLSGLTDAGRFTAFTPTGTNPLDSIGECIDLMRADGYQPGAVLLHPSDYGQILRMKRGEDGGYALDSGRDILNGAPSLWGVPAVTNPEIEQGTFIVLDPACVMLFMRQEATVELFEQDDTNVQYNLVTVRAELRAALAVFAVAGVRFGDLVAELDS